MNLVLDAVDAGHHQRGEREVRVCHRIRETHFDAAALRIRDVRNTNRCRAVARGVGENGRRLEARHQALVAVGRRVGERIDRLRVLDYATDIVKRGLGKAAVAIAREQVLAVLEQRLVHVHAVTVVVDQRLRHEGGGLAVRMRDVVHDVLQDLHFVGLAHERVELGADLALTGRRHFVVMHFGRYAQLFDRETHRRANVVQRIHRRHREVTALDGRPVTGVALFDAAVGVPGALLRVNLVERALHVVVPRDAIEHEELVLRAEISLVGDAGRFQVGLGACGQRTRTAIVALHCRRLDDIAAQIQCWLVRKNVDDRGTRVGHQDHVGLVNPFPS